MWLIQDEIASGVCSIFPTTLDTLEMVATHVKNADDKPMCLFEKVPLMFVFGADNSLVGFVEVSGEIQTWITPVGI